MTLGTYLFTAAPRLVSLIVLTGFVNGLCSAAVLVVINRRLHHADALPMALALGFLGLIVAKVTTAALSEILLVRFAQHHLLALLDRLCRNVVRTPLRQLERLGSGRIMAVLTEDVGALGDAMRALPSLIINGATMVGCGVYLAWLSTGTFLGIVGVIALGVVTYKVVMARAQTHYRRLRDGRDALFGHLRAVTDGVKELKLHRGRRRVFFDQDMATTFAQVRRDNVAGTVWYILGNSCSNAFFYLLIGLLLFAAPVATQLTREALTGYVFACLYMMAPMWSLLNSLPVLGRGQVALEKIAECEIAIAAEASAQSLQVEREVSPLWSRLELSGVVFDYGVKGAASGEFVLGPLDLTFHPKEVTFLVGGNGSGKSTFVKLLTGLYTPQAGEVKFDGELVTDSNREWYRHHFATVFTDFFLFPDLRGLEGPDLSARAAEYLTRLQLDHKVRITEGRFSTIDLSQGQRKRLALLTAYLEDRPICVFDEWAADQDPTYKEVFYRELLPELKARGKAVVVITHDDRYFHLGDRVVKLDYGRVVEDVKSGA
jgi:putative pyoverdin transport system ATP-binding/permease protein